MVEHFLKPQKVGLSFKHELKLIWENFFLPPSRLKKENKHLSKKLSAAEACLESQKKEIDKNTESIKTGKKVSENNLKYLINLDRNNRRKNVILFGVPEKDDLTIHNESATSDI